LDHKFVWEYSRKTFTNTGKNRTILFYVGHTVTSFGDTGIQRVTRRFAVELLEQGYEVLLVKWNPQKGELDEISLKEFEHLSKWNGPQSFDRRALGTVDIRNTPLVLPEVPYMDKEHQSSILKLSRWARNNSVTTSAIFYDDIPLRLDHEVSLREQHKSYMLELLEVDQVFPISNYSKDNLVDFWATADLPEDIVKPVVHSIPLATNSFTDKASSPYSTESRMILCVGTIEHRKNQLTLISAFNRYFEENPKSDWKLHLVGHVHPEVKIQFESQIRNSQNIVYHGPVNDDVLADLYNRCSFTVCSSIEEGYGLPIAESISHGRPSICANFGAMAEVASVGGCLTTDVRKVNDLAEAIYLLTTQMGHRTFLKSQIPAASDLRSWKNYVEEYFSFDSTEQEQRTDLAVIYYFLDSTIRFKRNTGIQRVVRQTASALLDSGDRKSVV
jgi:glycosyltransferase involved in cell wall biosynthesis